MGRRDTYHHPRTQTHRRRQKAIVGDIEAGLATAAQQYVNPDEAGAQDAGFKPGISGNQFRRSLEDDLPTPETALITQPRVSVLKTAILTVSY